MRFTETKLKGAFLLDEERHEDARGFFARTFCKREFAAHGLDPEVAQQSVSYNKLRGTLRGMHFQFPPAAEAKLIRVTRGALLDVIVDLRPESPTFLQHFAVELAAGSGRSIYIPRRFAHGYQVLQDHTELTYQMTEFYAPALGFGLAHDDPRLGVPWPLPVTAISDKDREWPRLATFEAELRAKMASDGRALA